MADFPEGFSAVVFGAGGGIGSAFVRQLAQDARIGTVYACSRTSGGDADGKVVPLSVDILSEDSLSSAAEQIKEHAPRLVIVASGVLHAGDGVQPEKTWKHLAKDQMEHVFAINTVAPALIMKHFLPLLPREGKSVFAALSARVGSISDNGMGGWYSYRASKAALNMLLRTAAIEHGRRWKEACVIGLHPGTVDTGLSEPFQSNVSSNKLFTPDYSATQMLSVIDKVSPEDSGQVFDYAGKVIPF
ncbi:MAG: SDR family NAD(P)-dependent oxidoreductase [Pseudomonadota bacterium]